MYAILKEGVYLQGVWFSENEEDAEVLLDRLVKSDKDDYHTWSLRIVEEGVESASWEEIKSVKKPVKGLSIFRFNKATIEHLKPENGGYIWIDTVYLFDKDTDLTPIKKVIPLGFHVKVVF